MESSLWSHRGSRTPGYSSETAVPSRFGSTERWVHVDTVYRSGASDYLTAFPVTLKQGENRLLVALYKVNPNYFLSGFFGFEDGTEYTVPGSEETQEVVNIPDASLRAAIEKALGKDAGSRSRKWKCKR